MTIYQYACKDCDLHFEKRQSFSDQPLSTCLECQGQVERVISPVGIIFKGSGFYINDSKSSNGKNGSNGTGSASKNKSSKSQKETAKQSGKEKPKPEKTASAASAE